MSSKKFRLLPTLALAAALVVALVLGPEATFSSRSAPRSSPADRRADASGQGLPYFTAAGSLPAWAEAGAFRFVRLDGGAIESRKAERTWWGQHFSTLEKDVLAQIYGRHFEQMLRLLKQARFNWIWVTWSNGWSLREEAGSRAELRRVIRRCHEEGIRVTAYLSASNLFWRSTRRDEPQTLQWLLRWHGLPIPYGGSLHRLLADTRYPGWRAYVLHKAELALEAGVDGIFYDNIFGDPAANRALLSETQWLAEAHARRSGRPKALVYANVHPGPERFAMNDHCDLIWDESGKDSPGVWEGDWQVGNARKLKFLAGEKQAWQPIKYENDFYHCGAREACIPSPAEAQLGIAEAAAFGGALSRNLEGAFLKALIRSEPAALAAWSAIASYHEFLEEHAWLYQRVVPVARLALLSRSPMFGIADRLLRLNVPFQTKVLGHLDKGEPLSSFGALLIPFALPHLEERQRRILARFAAAGGTLLAADPASVIAQLGDTRARVIPLSRSAVSALAADSEVRALADEAVRASGGPLLTVHSGGHLLVNLSRKRSSPALLVHLLNYDHQRPAREVRLTLDLHGLLPAPHGLTATSLSPDGAGHVRAVQRGQLVELTVREVRRYSVIVLSASAAPSAPDQSTGM